MSSRVSFSLLAAVLMVMMGTPALAEICNADITDRARLEAEELLDETFVKAVTADPDGKMTGTGRRYNERLITCSRKRDSNGNKIEREIEARHTFANNLEPVAVKGKFQYYGLFGLKYAYQLERVKGTWIVTVPIEFHWPSARMTDRVDIPEELADELGLTASGEICQPGRTSYTSGNNSGKRREILQGFVGDESDSLSTTHPKDVMYYGDSSSATTLNGACRLKRGMLFKHPVTGLSKTPLNHLRDYWRAQIEAHWNRPGFEIKPVFLDCENAGGTQSCDKHSEGDRNIWEKSKLIWKPRFNLDPNHRPSFKRWAFKWNNMHTGVQGAIVAHELGHWLGLDDEYGAPDLTFEITGKPCGDVKEGASSAYLMCAHRSGISGAQAIYPWIITRRYAVGKPLACKEDTDCAGGYCDKGTLTIGRNQCVAYKEYGETCSRDGVCGTGRFCAGKPLGKCIVRASVAIGKKCIADKECITGACNVDRVCQCKDKIHCGSNQYCATGVLGVGKNKCERIHAYGSKCSKDDQCGPGNVCQGKPAGKCITPASVSVGGSCIKDAECKTGSCDKDGKCQCKSDGDCASSHYCDKGWATVGKNQCVKRVAYGGKCSRNEQCGGPEYCKGKPLGKCIRDNWIAVGKSCIKDTECTSGSCNKDGKCQCKDSGDCGSGKYCDTGTLGVGKNSCKAHKKEGVKCSADKQCGKGLTCKGFPTKKCKKK